MKSINLIKRNGEVTDFVAPLTSLIRTLKNGEYTISIERKVKHRSVSQNRLLWLWLRCIADELGYTADDMYDYFCSKYLSKEVYGERVVTGTSKLDTKTFKEFLDAIQIFAASELGITLPDPDDLYFKEFAARFA